MPRGKKFTAEQIIGKLRAALKLADAMVPCVPFVDEIEKALAGATSSGQTDSGGLPVGASRRTERGCIRGRRGAVADGCGAHPLPTGFDEGAAARTRRPPGWAGTSRAAAQRAARSRVSDRPRGR